MYLYNIFELFKGEPLTYNLRSEDSQIRIPFARTELFKRSFFSSAIHEWNLLESDTKNSQSLSLFTGHLLPKKDCCLDILYYGERWASVHHARIRLGCSELNSHLHNNLHVIPSSSCACGATNEDPAHFFFVCPLYSNLRIELHDKILPVSTFNLHTLLYGDKALKLSQNQYIFDAVHEFIKNQIDSGKVQIFY